MRFTGNSLTYEPVFHVFSDFNDFSRGFMSDNTGKRMDTSPAPVVPVIDPDVCTADGGAADLHKDFILIDLRNGKVIPIFKSRAGPGLDNPSHICLLTLLRRSLSFPDLRNFQ